MHVLVPFASDRSEAARHVLGDLALPNLTRVVAEFTADGRDDGDAASLSPPHERALAAAWRWHGSDGAWPFAARAAAGDGVDVDALAWGLVTPCHWLLGRDHVVMTDPDALDLDEAESRALFEALRELVESDGFAWRWGAPLRWYLGRDDLEALPAASLDRVIGRDVEAWIGHDDERHVRTRRTVRRLQSEAQLVFHAHAVNEAREAADRPAVNSFWLSGCGRAQPADPAATPLVADDLRAPLLGADWVAWGDAWRALDAGPIRAVRDAGNAAAAGGASLTLCGERSAVRLAARPLPAWQRLRARFSAASPQAVLETL